MALLVEVFDGSGDPVVVAPCRLALNGGFRVEPFVIHVNSALLQCQYRLHYALADSTTTHFLRSVTARHLKNADQNSNHCCRHRLRIVHAETQDPSSTGNPGRTPAACRQTQATDAQMGSACRLRFALCVLSAVSAYYLSWAEDQQVVTIRIINTVSGEVVTYRAHRGDIDGRKFTTTDGLTVRMADADRFEVLRANDG